MLQGDLERLKHQDPNLMDAALLRRDCVGLALPASGCVLWSQPGAASVPEAPGLTPTGVDVSFLLVSDEFPLVSLVRKAEVALRGPDMSQHAS